MLSIVIPAYNEERRLPESLSAIKEYLTGRDYEVVVVDDGSTDSTAKIAEETGCRVVRHSVNMGKGAAVKTGVLGSKGEVVLVTDADLAAPITELPKLERMMKTGANIVIGSREAPGAVVKRSSLKRKLAGKVFNLLVRRLAGLPHRDTQCGFKLFRGETARVLFSLAGCSGYCFDVEVLLLAGKEGFKVEEAGVEWHDKPGSKVNLLRDGRRMLAELLEIRRKCVVTSSPAIPGTSAPGSASSPVS